MIERSDALALDAADPLASWRDEFVIPDPELIYLDGNSLGRTPKRAVEALHRVVDEWAGDLIASWWEHDWLNLTLTVGDELAPLLGAAPGEVAVHESTTVGIFQLLNVALDLAPGRRVIAIDDDDFPTDRYAVEGVVRMRCGEIRRGHQACRLVRGQRSRWGGAATGNHRDQQAGHEAPTGSATGRGCRLPGRRNHRGAHVRLPPLRHRLRPVPPRTP